MSMGEEGGEGLSSSDNSFINLVLDLDRRHRTSQHQVQDVHLITGCTVPHLTIKIWPKADLAGCVGTQIQPEPDVQCESKKSPLRTCGIFSKTIGNFSTKCYMYITHSYLR